MDVDSPSQRRLLGSAELFGLRSTANPISSFSKEQELCAAKWEIETLQERLTSIEQQLLESKSKVEAQHQQLNGFTENLLVNDKLIQDAKVIIRSLEIREQDANGSIKDLRIKIQQLQDENWQLVADLDQAENDFITALGLAHNAAARRKSSITGGKRELAQVEHDSSSSVERSSKNARLTGAS